MGQTVEAIAIGKPLLRGMDEPGQARLNERHGRGAGAWHEPVRRPDLDRGSAADAQQVTDLGVLALDVAQLARERRRLEIDRLEFLALRGGRRLQRPDVVFGQVELPGVYA